MFEGTLIESQGLVGSGTKRWTALGSAVFQFGVAGLLIAIPLMHPGVLPIHMDPPQLVVPMHVKPPVVRVDPAAASTSPASMSMPMSTTRPALMPSLLPDIGPVDQGAEPVLVTGLPMGSSNPGGLLSALGPGAAPNVSVAPAKKIGPLNVSSGVSAGMLLTPIRPVYPAIAIAAGVQGMVVMEAVISKAGRIESLHAVSGPLMLRQAALDAAQAARYQPYRLNGEATEVQTTITVNFRLGS